MAIRITFPNGPHLDITTLQEDDVIGFASQKSQRFLKILRPGKSSKTSERLQFLEVEINKFLPAPGFRAAWINSEDVFLEVAILMAASAGKIIKKLPENKFLQIRSSLDVIWAVQISS